MGNRSRDVILYRGKQRPYIIIKPAFISIFSLNTDVFC